ncbi:MAG: TetR/AcrR family transcriptional regulator [Alphaproteobacteria bacterium]|nr:TetR/AcrR family transcriptional regulator [Alphaproteobacteria bacterium]
MTRPYKPAPARREELLGVAARLFAEQGYAETSVQAIIDALSLSKGAFYHHFESKAALLDALVAQHRAEVQDLLQPVVEDASLAADAKLLALMRTLNAWKLERRPLMTDLARALYEPGNGALLARHQAEMRQAMPPLLARIVAQGVAEGCFEVFDVDIAAALTWQLIVSFGESITPTLLAWPGAPSEAERTRAAYTQAIERLLGAAPGRLPLFEPEALRRWIEETPAQRS